MALASLGEMTTNFIKMKYYNSRNFLYWYKGMQFLLATLKVLYILNTLSLEENEKEIVAETLRRK